MSCKDNVLELLRSPGAYVSNATLTVINSNRFRQGFSYLCDAKTMSLNCWIAVPPTKTVVLQPGRILVPHTINKRLVPTWLPTESEAPSINPRCARFSFAFPRCFAFRPWRFTFPGDSSACPGASLFLAGYSSLLAVRVSLRFPCPGNSRVLAGRGLVVLQLQLKVGSWLLLVPPAV